MDDHDQGLPSARWWKASEVRRLSLRARALRRSGRESKSPLPDPSRNKSPSGSPIRPTTAPGVWRRSIPSGHNIRSVSGRSIAPYLFAEFATADCADFTERKRISPTFGESRWSLVSIWNIHLFMVIGYPVQAVCSTRPMSSRATKRSNALSQQAHRLGA